MNDDDMYFYCLTLDEGIAMSLCQFEIEISRQMKVLHEVNLNEENLDSFLPALIDTGFYFLFKFIKNGFSANYY